MISEQQYLPILNMHFKKKNFRKGQKEIIRSVLEQKDSLAVMPTGGGKSLCFQFPAVALNGLVVVISPLVALMKDQVDQLKQLGIPAGCLHAGQSRNEKLEVFKTIKSADTYVLYLSPERVKKAGFADWIKKQKLCLFAIDEAHCVSQWGPDFREDYHRLNLLRQLQPHVPILALTATATPEVLNDIGRQLGLNHPDRHVYGFYRSNLFYQVENCGDDFEKSAYLLQALRQTSCGKILIYCGTRKKSEETALFLEKHFSGVDYYHAGMSTEQRKEVQDQMASGQLRILAATNAFGMGINYSDVRLVVHMQMPANIESLYQEMGRAGRDGQPALCLLLYSKKDKGLQSYFIQQSTADTATIRRRWKSLDAITRFCEGGECRHSGILTYFRDSDRIDRCGHCDSCSPTDSMRVTLQNGWNEENLYKTKSNKKVKMPASDFVLKSDEAKELHDKLKVWRKEYAKANDLPAFMVFSNKTLIDLANRNPTCDEELYQVYGFGQAKVDGLGPEILRCLQT